MKVKVDKLTYKEFAEYADSTFARQVRVSIYIFLGIAVLAAAIGLGFKIDEAALKPLFWCIGILFVLSAATKWSIGYMFRRSKLSSTQCRYSFDDAGMDIAVGKLKGDLDWEHIKFIKETKNLWIIRVPNSQFILPKRCCEEGLSDIFLKNVPEYKMGELKHRDGGERLAKDRCERSGKTEGNNAKGEGTEQKG